jgi:hypothetical protein
MVARFNKREEAKFLSAFGSRKERKAIKECRRARDQTTRDGS